MPRRPARPRPSVQALTEAVDQLEEVVLRVREALESVPEDDPEAGPGETTWSTLGSRMGAYSALIFARPLRPESVEEDLTRLMAFYGMTVLEQKLAVRRAVGGN